MTTASLKPGEDPIWDLPPLTLPLSEVRRLPLGHCPHLFCRAYWPVPRILPNGLLCNSLLLADAQIVIGGEFWVIARLLRSGPGLPPSLFQIERTAYDAKTGRWVPMPLYALSVVRAAYDLLAAQQVLANARHSSTERRN
jgi:hypothetical protein